jgi:uncharacterized membrane protein|tara:strand:- start:1995 stop:2858 length:864 start_codon:yes stop_codon:yes gene_type:complete
MHPFPNVLFAISGTMMFVGILFMGTGTTIPLFESQEETDVEFAYSGQSTILTFEQAESGTNNGWAVYSFGQYLDDDGDGNWDDCSIVQISFLNESDMDFFYPQCGNSSQREDVEEMVYVGQLCYDPSNSSSSRCEYGNYTFESNIYVRLLHEVEDDEGSLFSRLIGWFIDGLSTGRTLLCGAFPLILLGLISALFLSEEKEEPTKKKRGGPTAEWRAYSLTGQERGGDGLPKAFSRHSEKKDIFRKPRKGNVRGGVHKSGGLFLDGWTDEDSDAEYKKKVEDRRKER